jgi:hypothetical protein
LLSGILIVVCYGYALRLPFYFDDLPVLTWLGGRSLGEIWTASSENAYYRPLTFSIYRFGLLFPKGTQQVVLHAANLLLHWIGATLVMRLARRCASDGSGAGVSLLVALLYAVFPFLFRAVPWVTAMPHLLVVALTLAAALAALRAVEHDTPGWWAISLAATALAPFAHESGLVCGVIVGGLVIIHHGLRQNRHRPGGHSPDRWQPAWQRLAFVALGILLNVGAMFARSRLPGTGAFDPDGLNSWFENVMFFAQGLTYPTGQFIGWLVNQRGWHDFALILGSSLLLILLLAWLAVRTHRWRWIVGPLWWWAWGALPAAVTFRYGGLVNSPRFYALASPGIVMLWAGVIVELAGLRRTTIAPRESCATTGRPPRFWRALVAGILTATIAIPNISFLLNQRQVHLTLGGLYWEIIQVADTENAPLGYVNVPAWLAPRKQAYALSKDGMVGLPLYTNVWQLIGVNRETVAVDNVMFVHTLYEPQEAYFGFHGDWLDWEGMRQYALDHRTVWLTRHKEGRFVLHHVGRISRHDTPAGSALARFEGGPEIESATVQRAPDGHWTVALTWRATAPAEGDIFLHVVDAGNNLVTQADGPALGGMVPLASWQPGDRVYDVRHLDLANEGAPSFVGPYTVLVGVYDAQGRFPAYVDGVRQPGDAAPVAEITP